MVNRQCLRESGLPQRPSANRSHRIRPGFCRLASAAVLAIVCAFAITAESQVAEINTSDSISPSSAPSVGKTVELQGRVVCLAEEMNRLHQTILPTHHEHLVGFRNSEGKYFTLLRTKFSEALFVDQRLHTKDLIITGRVFPNAQILEVIRLRSLRDGRVFDVLYYCDICAIDMVEPGICLCCQQPAELIERPATRKSAPELTPPQPAP